LGTAKRVDQIAKEINYTQVDQIQYKGKKAYQYISEVDVQITRASKPKKRLPNSKRQKPIEGEPIKARLVVSRVLDEKGNELAIWYLISNVNTAVSAGTLALWYYWRWSIESFFKLLKSAGMQLESWQQQSGIAIARRLLVACMACVFVWDLAHQSSPEATELRKILIKVSGRQMKYGKEFTLPALLAGCWALLPMLDFLSNYDLGEIKSLLKSVGGSPFV